MNRHELKALNTELVDLLTLMRDLIDRQLDHLEAAEDDDVEDDDAESDQEGNDNEADDDDPAGDETDED